MMNSEEQAKFLLVVLIAASIFPFSTLTNQAYAQGIEFEQANNLSNSDDPSGGGWDIASHGNNVYVIWSEGSMNPDGSIPNSSFNLFFKASKDNGKSFGEVINLNDYNGNVQYPKIAVSGNNVYVVWSDGKNILFARSIDGGSTFSATILDTGTKDSSFPEITVSVENVYVAWQEGVLSGEPGVFTNTEIFFRASHDNGATFDPVINLSNNDAYSGFGDWRQHEKIAAYGNNVYVVWQDMSAGGLDIFLAKSTDKGSTFGTINLTNNSGASIHPVVAAFGNDVYVAYADDTHTGGRGAHYDVFFTKSGDNGCTFSEPVKLSKSEGAGLALIALSGKNVYVVWQDNYGGYGGNIDILFARSANAGDSFEPAINLSNSGFAVNERVAVSGNNVYIAWQQKVGEKHEVFFRSSSDYGATFGTAVNLSKGTGDSGSPMVAASGAHVYVTWMDNGVGNADIFFRAGTDLLFKADTTVTRDQPINKSSTCAQSSDLSFANSINLSNDDAGIAYHEIAANGSYVYVVWAGAAVSGSGQFIGNADIFFRASKDNGITFNNVINVSKNSGNSILPRIAVSGNNVYIVWQDDSDGDKEIFFVRSTDNGATFSNPVNLSNDTKDSVFPQIAVSSNSVYVVWQDGMSSGIPDAPLPNADILFRASTDKGATFGNINNLSKNDGYSQVPQIAVSGNNVYVVWYDTTPGNLDVFLARSTNGGASFNAINISKSSGFSTHPRIAVSGSNVYVIWFDDTNQGGLGANADIFFARSTDSGANFSDAVTLWSNNRKSGGGAQIAAQSNNVYVVWSEGETNYSRTFDVFFVRSTDNGASFDSPVNLSNNAWSSDNPVIAVSGSGVYIAWQDNTPGNGDPSKNWDAFLRMSKDNGASFGSIINVSNNEGPSFGPKIALSGDNVYVAWMDNGVGNGDVLFTVGTAGRQSAKQIQTSLEPISINYISNPKPRWGLDEVTISGIVNKPSSLDTITIDWGDDTISNVRIIQPNGSWGPASHTYDLEHVGKKQIVAKLFSGRVLKASSTPYEIDVQKHVTSITIDEIADLKPGSPITVKGSLIDEDAKVGISGRIITFNGTGASDLERTVTFKGGTFSSKGTAATKASAVLTVQAHFAGDSVYLASSSNVVTYNAGKFAEEEPKASDKPKEKVVGEPKEKIETSDAINVEMKQKKALTLISVKNNNAEDVFEVKIKVSDGSIKFVKARGWDRERVDQSTVIVSTDDRPVTAGRNLIIILIANNTSLLEWFAVNESGVEISRGILRNE